MKKIIKSFILTLAVLVGVFTLVNASVVFAAGTETEAGIDASALWEWKTYGDGVAMTAYNGTQTDVYIPNKIETEDGVTYDVIKLGDELFKGNTGINSATLAEGITEIGASAFEGATSLVCIVSPESLTTIGDGAFKGCTEFNSVILYEGVTEIGDGAFDGCTNVTVYCVENSPAHTYVVDNNIRYVLLGEATEPEIYTVDGVTYYIQDGEAVATAFDGSSVSVVIPATVEGYPVTRLVATFKNWTSLKSVTLPNSLTYIGESAFYGCTGLTSIEIPDSVITIENQTFFNCTSLSSIDFSAGLKEIGFRAFYNCDGLTNIVIPDGVTTLGSDAFYHCNNITNLVIPDSVTTIEGSAFNGCWGLTNVKLPNNLTEIGVAAFAECKLLTSIVIPDTVTVIGSWAFRDCAELAEIKISENITELGNGAFENCTKIRAAIVPKSVSEMYNTTFYEDTVLVVYENSYAHSLAVEKGLTYITVGEDSDPKVTTVEGMTYLIASSEAGALSYSGSATTVEIPDKIDGNPVTSITGAFKDNTSVKSIVLPESLKTIGKDSFYGCTALTSIEIPDGVTFIGNSAFRGCNGIKNLVIPDSVVTIDEYAFYSSGLISIDIPDSVTTIGNYAFYGCYYAESIKMSANVTVIGYKVFQGCSRVTSVSLPEGVTTIGSGAFNVCGNLRTLVIPKSVTQMYSDSLTASTILIVYENSYAHEFAINNNFSYVLITEGSTLKMYTVDGVTYIISGNEAIAISFDGSSTVVNIPEKVEGYPVTKLIGTFRYCTELTSVSLPNTIKEIGASAFFDCDGLTSIEIPNGVTAIGDKAFCGCDRLTSITIPAGVATIGASAFQHCRNLTTADISDGVATIMENAFAGCTKLVYVYVPSSVTEISSSTFEGYALPFEYSVLLVVNEDSCAYDFAKSYSSYAYITVAADVTPQFFVQDGITYLVADKQAMTMLFDGSVTDVVIPEKINEYPVMKLLDAFKDCTTLTSVSLPDTLEVIGENAFYGCTGLTEIEIPDSVTTIESAAFRGCSGLTSIKIPDGITMLADNLFRDCSSLTSIDIPESVTEYGSGAFRGCSSLTSMQFPDGTTSIASYLFYGCTGLTRIEIPESVTVIGSYAFYNCKGLTDIYLSDYITVIVDWAFAGCTGLTSIEIPDSVTEIGGGAFAGCIGLTSIEIPDSITSISASMFKYCRGLESITIPDSVTTIGVHAFEGCSSLKSINIPDGVTEIRYNTFQDCISLADVHISESATYIEQYAFQNCKSLKNIVIPGSVKKIYGLSFTGCSNLSNIIISDGVEFIGGSAFYNSDKALTVMLPDSVTTIFANSFADRTIWLVSENSYAYTYAVDNGELYFLLRKTANPDIAYGAGIAGTAAYTDGTVASGAAVEILYDDGTVKQSTTTDDDGAYSFTYAEVGRYTIRVTDSDGNTASEVVSVKRMNAFDVFLAGETNLVLKKGYTVSGTVSGAATVTITDTDGNVLAAVETTDGTFAFENIPNGSYIVKAETENGSAMQEIYVYNGDVNDIDIVIESTAAHATISGDIQVEERDGKKWHRKAWVGVVLYNSDGVVVAHTKTNNDGAFKFTNVPLGSYTVVAKTTELRKDKHHGHDRDHDLYGYGYVVVTEAADYVVELITMREDKPNKTELSGKVRVHGSPTPSTVTLTDENGDEIAVVETGSNGKYTFKNIPDGMYFITAVTKYNGMGFTTVTINNGRIVGGDTDITVAKSEKIKNRESALMEFKDCRKEDVDTWKSKVLEEKRFYDGLTDREKKELSQDWLDLLFKLIGWMEVGSVEAPDGVTVEGEESILSEKELESKDEVKFVLTIGEVGNDEVDDDGINTKDEYIRESAKNKGNDKTIAKYYDISLAKDGHKITNIHKHTDTTGKLRITMDIPEEYRGHKHYTFIHVHNGEPTTLVDLDKDPNTVTFEVDRFSTFALAYSDTELTEEESTPASISYNAETGKIAVSSTEAGTLYIATYEDGCMTELKAQTIAANAEAVEFDFAQGQAAFVWNDNMNPLCDKFTLGN
ncbi:MAG: leucine-rich repeat protein [Clostridia bacterium]|nr:leucine-rich repeat protein [Clostridia bacterium]